MSTYIIELQVPHSVLSDAVNNPPTNHTGNIPVSNTPLGNDMYDVTYEVPNSFFSLNHGFTLDGKSYASDSNIIIKNIDGVPLDNSGKQFRNFRGSFANNMGAPVLRSNMSFAFQNASNPSTIDFDSWDFNNVTNTEGMFASTNFNISFTSNHTNLTDVSGMFLNCSSLNNSINILSSTSTVNASYIFSGCGSLNSPITLDFNISNASFMFHKAYDFNQPITLKTPTCTTLESIFENAREFNQSVSTSGDSWKINNVTTLKNAFKSARAFNQDINWSINTVTNMSGMFEFADAFNGDINFVSAVNTDIAKNVIDFSNMFHQAISYNKLPNLQPRHAQNMSYMFTGSLFNHDISNWNVSSVTNFSYMFSSSPFNHPLSAWDTSSAIDMSYMFADTANFNQNISNWNTINVENMVGMFLSAKKFNQNLGSWNFSSIGTDVSFNIMGNDTLVPGTTLMFASAALTYQTATQFVKDLAQNNTVSNTHFIGFSTFLIDDSDTRNAITDLSNNNVLLFDDNAGYDDLILPIEEINAIYDSNNEEYIIDSEDTNVITINNNAIIVDEGGLYGSYDNDGSVHFGYFDIPANYNMTVYVFSFTFFIISDVLEIYEDSENGQLLFSAGGTYKEEINLTNISRIYVKFEKRFASYSPAFIIRIHENTPLYANICFVKNTPVDTDQGIVEIQKITTNNTIRGSSIKHITETVSKHENLVLVKKDAFYNNVPSQDTIMSREHAVFINGYLKPIKFFVNNISIIYVQNNGEVLYNILLDKHDLMVVNNMIVETLHPDNLIAKVYNDSDNMTVIERKQFFKRINYETEKRNVYVK